MRDKPEHDKPGEKDFPDGELADTPRKLHRFLLESLIADGRFPNDAALASRLQLEPDGPSEHLQMLVEADYVALDSDSRIACLYPFSVNPTPHAVMFDGIQRFAMCAIDALGMAAMLGRPVEIVSSCPVCTRPIKVETHPGEITYVNPAETVVAARREMDTPAFEACCQFTVFACGPAHGAELANQMTNMTTLDLSTALMSGESIFGELLGPQLPARRKRMRFTQVSADSDEVISPAGINLSQG